MTKVAGVALAGPVNGWRLASLPVFAIASGKENRCCIRARAGLAKLASDFEEIGKIGN